MILNQLLGAQSCDGSAWGYYVQMEGKKPYSSNLDGHCCLSSGPRGLALIPTFAITTDEDGVVVNLYDGGSARLTLRDGTPVSLTVDSHFPSDGEVHIAVESSAKKPFTVKVRIPSWCSSASVRLDGRTVTDALEMAGYLAVTRRWDHRKDLEVRMKLEPKMVVGDHLNNGKVALEYGPLVLAADQALLGTDKVILKFVGVGQPNLGSLEFAPEPAPEPFKTWPSAQVYRINTVVRRANGTLPMGTTLKTELIPFADAGGTGSPYEVWLPVGLITSPNLCFDGKESQSRFGNLSGSFTDDSFLTAAATFDGKPADEDWFAVTLDQPAPVSRVVFGHGRTFHDGGWFDASAGKPRIQIKAAPDAEWQTVGELPDYPATTASSPTNLKGGESFTLRLPNPVTVVAVRVIGKPSSGDNPNQAFASCSELQAFKEK